MIPDSAICYVPGYGETTVGALREQTPKESRWEADLRRLEQIATENLCRVPEWAGDTPAGDGA